MELKGVIFEIHPVVEVNEKFKKRELIIEYAENPTYPEFIKFEAQQDKCELLDKFKVGENVEVFFNLKGRPWTNKEGVTSYFNNMVVWRINSLGAEAPTPEYARPVDISSSPDDQDDLPF